jgi:hypothetical protein
MRWSVGASDPAYRIPALIALISLGLGVVSVGIGITGIIPSRFTLPQFGHVGPSPKAFPTKSGTMLFPVLLADKVGFIDRQGKLVVAPQFDGLGGLGEFSEGLTTVCIGKREDLQQGTARCGYIGENGQMVINPQFTSAGSFVLGRAAASTVETYGYIDRTGKFIIPEQFDSANEFDAESGLAVVCEGKGDGSRCGYIDVSGRFAINPQFYAAEAFKGGIAWVRRAKGETWSYINRSGHLIWKGEPETPKK